MKGFAVPGFSILRLLADRDRSKLFLAREFATGTWCALKFQKPSEEAQLAELARRDEKLKPVTLGEGFLQILASGVLESNWTWKALTLADNLPGLPPLDSPEGVAQYTPLNLIGWRMQRDGPPPASVIAQWGVRLANALAALHSAGLVHRDVKPANILFVGGEPCIGDYGLVGEPGGRVDYRGTEGYQPVEGTDDPGADLFALGRTLYESWTGENRLEFPSLPRNVLDAADWRGTGRSLNEVILKTCHPLPQKRYGSATELAAALNRAAEGRPLNRRRWLGTVGVAAAGAGLFYAIRSDRPPFRLVWRRLREKGFNVEGWRGHSWTADWERRRVYSFTADLEARRLQSLDLNSFDMNSKLIAGDPFAEPVNILHPQTGELCIIEGGYGPVYSLDLETHQMIDLGGQPNDQRHFNSSAYWNPVTSRIGIFGGYGHFAVRNDRCEFDPVSKAWMEVEADAETTDRPWRRGLRIPLIAAPTGDRLFVVGGRGSLSGKQGVDQPDLPGFDGQFHFLDDIWDLDLKSGRWTCLLPRGHLNPARLTAAAYFDQFGGLVVFEGGASASEDERSRAFLLRPGQDDEPVPLPSTGDSSELWVAWTCTTDPENGELLVLASDGIFRVSAVPA